MPYGAGVERWRALVRRHTPKDLRGDAAFERIALATIQAESGGDPEAVGDRGASVGLFQLHERGLGRGLSHLQRSDPDTNASRAVPQLAAAYRAAGGDPTQTYIRAINPGARPDGPEVGRVMNAYGRGAGGGGGGPKVQMSVTAETAGGTRVAGGAAVADTQTKQRAAAQVAEKRRQLQVLLQREEVLSTPGQRAVTVTPRRDPQTGEVIGADVPAQGETTSVETDTPEGEALAKQREARLADVRKQIADTKTDIDRLEKEGAAEADRAAKEAAAGEKAQAKEAAAEEKAAAKKPSAPEDLVPIKDPRTGAVVKLRDPATGQLVDLPDKAGGFQPMTENETAMLPIQQQNARSTSLNAAANWLTAQISQGRLDFDKAKQIFDYVKDQTAPVEEGGKLYRAGREPSNRNRQTLGLPTSPYSAVDVGGLFGRPELNQYVRGPYPFGRGEITPEEYKSGVLRTPAAVGGGSSPAAAVAGPTEPGPTFGAEPALSAQDEQTRAALMQEAPQAPPSFGSTSGLLQEQQALMQDTEKIRQMLISKGYSPQIADAAARRHLGMGATTAQTPF